MRRRPSISSGRTASLFRSVIKERSAHRMVRADVALAHQDLEQMRAAGPRAEHLRARPQVRTPDAAEPLVEAHRIERLDLLPARIEALRPCIERERVVAAQGFDVQHLRAHALPRLDRLGEAGDPAAGKDVVADEELGLVAPEVADEVNDAQRAGLHRVGVRLDDIEELIASRVLERADRQELVVLARDLAEVAFDQSDLVGEAAARDLGRELVHLLRRRVDAGADRAVALVSVEEQPAPAAADVDEGLTARELHLAADAVHLVDLRLLEGLRALLPVRAGVHHADAIEPVAIERLADAVMEAGVDLRLSDRAVGEAELVPP